MLRWQASGFPQAQQIHVPAIQHQFPVLVVNGGLHRHQPGCTLGFEFSHRQFRIERVVGENTLEEFCLDFNKANQGVTDHVREQARTGGGKAQDLQAMGKRTFQAALAAIFGIVVDRMIVARHCLEGRKIGIGDGA